MLTSEHDVYKRAKLLMQAHTTHGCTRLQHTSAQKMLLFSQSVHDRFPMVKSRSEAVLLGWPATSTYAWKGQATYGGAGLTSLQDRKKLHPHEHLS